MRETARIAQQMKQAFVGEAWHGPAVMEILANVDAQVARAKPIAKAHSIWEIVLHLTSTQDVLLSRLRGVAKNLTPDQDWPAVADPTEEAWQQAVGRLKRGDETLRQEVVAFPVERLDIPLAEGGSSAYNNFHGYIQHNLYHAAQMGLLERLARVT